DRTTHQNLEVVRADVERNVLLVRGPVPGPKNGLVLISRTVKRRVPSGSVALKTAAKASG
ncbi:MAG: 50S ribosomal protein L3, partial [Candidatus Eremiobacteraeota bacterium]|nr:50S ribosomal protein L3 [Candidatus Eremiobacteraeota bacterium]MBV8356066.1 50S ribosomal protein L3 [Candidatus Eremiobacteraeota bacterium]